MSESPPPRRDDAPEPGAGPLVYIVACEPSGDALGAGLIAALRRRSGGAVRFAGLGGERMAAEGFRSLYPLREFAVMGFAEVLPRIPRLLRRQRAIVRDIRARRPAAIVTIDSSSFNKRLADRLIRAGVAAPRIHYVAPMVWAWRPGRVHGMARRFDHLMTLFPFEPPLFEAAGLPATCVGHPAIEAEQGDGAAFRHRHGIGPEAPLLCILPGSRPGEVTRLLPVFGAAVARLRAVVPGLRVVAPTVPLVAEAVETALAGWGLPAATVRSESEKRDAFAASDAALAASGTVTLELGLSGVPMVVAYRAHPLTIWLAARLIRVPHVSLVNILLERGLVPELLGDACRPDALADALRLALCDPAERSRQRAGFVELRRRLDQGGPPPSMRAAELVLALAGAARPGQIPDLKPHGGER